MKKVSISKSSVLKNADNYWNAFNDVLALSETSDLKGLLYLSA